MESTETIVEDKSAQPVEETATALDSEAKTAPKSAKAPPVAKVKEKRAAPPGIERLKAGTQVKGKVRKVVDFGAFVDIGVGRDGLIHISALKRAGIDGQIRTGQVLDVVVRRVNVENNRISLVVPRPKGETKTRLQDLRVDSVVAGRVVRLVDFGAFVDVGARVDGLLHVSQLPRGYTNHPSEVLKVGDEIQVRILGVDSRKRRISLSMKEPGSKGHSKEVAPALENYEHIPTAFEVAFQEALAKRRRRAQR